MDIYNILRSRAAERNALIHEFINDKLPEIRALGIAGEHIDDNTVRWWLVPELVDYLIQNCVQGNSIYDPPKRANGERWGFVGYEIIELPENTVMGHNGSGNDKNMLWAYSYGDYSPPEYMPDCDYAILLSDCIRMEMYQIRMMAVHDLVNCGFLKLPEDTANSTLGTCLHLK